MRFDLTKGSAMYGDPFSLGVAAARTRAVSFVGPIRVERLWPPPVTSFADVLDEFARRAR